jgi:hypothetical protein
MSIRYERNRFCSDSSAVAVRDYNMPSIGALVQRCLKVTNECKGRPTSFRIRVPSRPAEDPKVYWNARGA